VSTEKIPGIGIFPDFKIPSFWQVDMIPVSGMLSPRRVGKVSVSGTILQRHGDSVPVSGMISQSHGG
jgi:hypothetical protein